MQANQVNRKESKESAYSQVKRLYKSVINTANIKDNGYSASHTALFVCSNKSIEAKNIDTNAFCTWVHALTGIKNTTTERYLRLFKSIDVK